MAKKEVIDGIICPEKFGNHPNSNLRILWILKEANDPGKGGWSLIDFLGTRNDDTEGLFHYEKWAATWGLVIKVSWGLLNNCKSFIINFSYIFLFNRKDVIIYDNKRLIINNYKILSFYRYDSWFKEKFWFI